MEQIKPMEQNKSYTIYNGIFSFNPEFNDFIRKSHTDAMTSCHTLKFTTHQSEYSVFNKPIPLNTIPSSITNIILGSCFDNHISLPTNLVKIKFGYWFNQEVKFPQTVKYIYFDIYYNKPTILPNNLLEVHFGEDFNCEIILPMSLVRLRFGYEFKQRVILPEKLLWMEINTDNHWICDNIPNSIKTLELGEDFSLPLVSLPNKLKCVVIHGCKYSHPLTNISENVEVIRGWAKSYDFN